MTVDQSIGMAGILITVVVGLVAFFVKTKTKANTVKQTQTGGDGATMLQVGRDLNTDKQKYKQK